jgi:hypothetical protein
VNSFGRSVKFDRINVLGAYEILKNLVFMF